MLIYVAIILVTSLLVIRFYLKVNSLPPGPFPFPLIGNFPQMAIGMASAGGIVGLMRKWKQEYGDVYTWWMGPMVMVNICDYDVAQEAMVKKGNLFVDRPYMYVNQYVKDGRGIVVSNGQHWQEQRRFALHTLRNFGLGRNLMEDRIMLEYDYRTKKLDEKILENGGCYNFDPHQLIDLTVGNIINRLLFSERFTEEREKRFFSLKKSMDETMENIGLIDMTLNEWMVKIPYFRNRLERINRPIQAIADYMQEQVDLKKEAIASGKYTLRDGGDDFADAFLIEMAKEEKDESFDEKTMKMTLLDLWFAGQETTTTTMYWALAYFLLHPQVVEKAQAELDAATGRNRHLSLADKPKTPYFNAVILVWTQWSHHENLLKEILRLSSIVPVNAWRVAAEDVLVGGRMVPKGTMITAQLSLILSDEKYFEERQKFKPERFLEKGLDHLNVAFGMGKRACLGESLARAELYLILGNLLLNYNLFSDPENLPSMRAKSEMGVSRQAQPYHVNVSRRS